MPGFKRITDLPTAGAIAGNELVEVSQPSATIRISAATISAAALDNSFNDAGAGFVTAGFLPGDRVQVAGFVTGGNNMVAGVIASVTASKIVIGGGPLLADEAAGTTVTIAKWTSRRIDLNAAVAATAAVQANTAKAGNATHTGDVTGSVSLTIAAGVVSNSKLANMVTGTLKGRLLGSTGSPQDLTGTEVTTLLNTFTSALKGLVPPPGTPSGAFLRDDGNWAVPAGGVGGGGGLIDGDKGDVTVSGSGAIWTIDPGAVTLPKMADVPTATFLGRSTAGTGAPEALSAAQAIGLLPNFGGSGPGNSKGLVPNPGNVAGSIRFLCEDGTWKTIPLGISTKTGAYTLTNDDFTGSNLIVVDSVTDVTITLNTGLTALGPLLIQQENTGKAVIAGTATLRSRNGMKTAGTYAVLSIIPRGSDVYVISGDVTV